MECQRAQEEILESFIESRPADVQATVDAHVAGCAACATFAEKQRLLDRHLAAMRVPPASHARFRAVVRERVHHERRIFWSDSLPDVVHFASCGVVTVLMLVWSPLSTPSVLTLATAATLLTHIVLTAAHDSFDAAEDRAF